ncbi:Predicted metal-dependent hydrolase, TIM-barrel fold [Paracidovorax konjaci]|uniref:Predicted metal-dependent hydrolase, TIM-barrel fold n=1 Tax=Paracidovorax konjaci TaxID=32040 RepID=A0A1I1Y2C6_9BURK|nr:Predicted metal-dependent hydrolase, TIM-barrel fold [Paracidovorax konjaci]
MSNYLPVRDDWLALAQEPVREPALPIVDAHHHFYDRPGWTYLAADYAADTGSGHDVRASVHMQALTRYLTAGPEALKPVGETEFVVAATGQGPAGGTHAALGIVGYGNLRLGDAVRPVLEAHLEAGRGRFRGVRHLTTWDADPTLTNPLSAVPPGLLGDRAYREGVAHVAALGLSFDAWLFFTQLPELRDLAKAFPAMPVIVNHCGGVVRIGAYAAHRAEAFGAWRRSMRELAELPNVFVKLGGLGMRINGFGFEQGERPPSSEHLAETWRPWMETCIEAFGADRCMFESNFPVDKGSYSYRTLWNAFKAMTASAAPGERRALFEGTATRVYRLARGAATDSQ